ncbi:hypothetical protein ACFWBB_17465 [Streptomyces sp. NPDC060000]
MAMPMRMGLRMAWGMAMPLSVLVAVGFLRVVRHGVSLSSGVP